MKKIYFLIVFSIVFFQFGFTQLSVYFYSVKNVTCNGYGDGSASVYADGGSGYYNYSWSNSTTGNYAGYLAAGFYSVTATDVYNGWTGVGTIQITEPSAIVYTDSIVNPTCFGATNGAIFLNVSGGVPPYTYYWFNESTLDHVNNIPASEYYWVDIYDATDCGLYTGFTVIEPPQINISFSKTDAHCGMNDGSASVTVTNGVGVLSYQWDDPLNSTTSFIDNLPVGVYHVTVTDSLGCSESAQVIISNIGGPTDTIMILSQPLCHGYLTGSAQAIVTGGTSPFIYNWSTGGVYDTILNVAGGTYFLTVTDYNGCQTVKSVFIYEPTQLTAEIFKTDVPCYNQTGGGSSWVNVSGGTPGYTYNWSNGSLSYNAYDLSSGEVFVTITDYNGCQIIKSETINPGIEIVTSYTSVNPACYGGYDGSIDLTVTGGNPPYSYYWSNGGNTEDLTYLYANLYYVTIYDNNGCSQYQGPVSIMDPPQMITTFNVTNPVCPGQNSGAIDLSLENGHAPFTYAWTGPNSTTYSTEDIANIPAGYYYIEVTDNLGCKYYSGTQLYDPAAMYLSLMSQKDSCNINNGWATVSSVENGYAPYSYLWSTSSANDTIYNLAIGAYRVTVTDSLNCSVSDSVVVNDYGAWEVLFNKTDLTCNGIPDGTAKAWTQGIGKSSEYFLWSTNATTDSIGDLAAGIYSVTVTDVGGCSKINSVEILQPQPIVLYYETENVNCYGDSTGYIEIFGFSGGTPCGQTLCTYSWSNGYTDPYNYNLIAGSYILTLTDGNGCEKIDTFVISEPPAVIYEGLTVTPVSCYNAEDAIITINASGGAGTMKYSLLGANFQYENTFTNVRPGIYYVAIMFDSTEYSCWKQYDTIEIINPDTLIASYYSSNVLCNGGNNGSVTVMATGGTPPFEYSIDGAETFQADTLFTGLAANTYILKARDSHGCMVYPGDAQITEPSPIVTTITGTQVSCYGGNNGTATVTTQGGVPGYTYHWSGGDVTATAQNLAAGAHYVTVTDYHFCVKTDSIILDQPDSISITPTVTDVSCFGMADGSIDLSVSGGTPEYSYLWSTTPAQTTATATGLANGIYTVTVTDTLGCIVIRNITVSEPTALMIIFTNTTDILCYGANDGSATATASGGTPPYLYSWSNDIYIAQNNNIGPGVYTVTVTDNNGCVVFDSISITQPLSALTIDSAIITNVLCNGGSDGSIAVYASGGTPAYMYSDDGGTTWTDTPIFTGLPYGNYAIAVKDINYCIVNGSSLLVDEPPAITSTLPGQTDITCFGVNDGTFTINVTGGVQPYLYDIGSGPVSNNTFTGLATGTYIITITDANNCTAQNTIIITEPEQLFAAYIETNITCYGLCNGVIVGQATGGVMPYIYSWGGLGIHDTLNDLCAGQYLMTVTDANGCINFATIQISEPEAMALTTSSTVSSCNICDGTATVLVVGGVQPYTYNWSDFTTDTIAINLCAGPVTVTVIDANGCTDSATVAISALALSTITGFVHTSGTNIADTSAVAELYKIVNSTDAELSYTVPLNNMSFAFGNVEYGQYFVRVDITNNTGLPYLLSTYLDSVVVWELADTINITCEQSQTIHLHMFEITPPVGDPIGSITGNISYGTYTGGKGIYSYQGDKAMGEPVPGAEVYVELEPDDEPIANTQTDTSGNYGFGGLPAGNDYTMSVDIPGLPLVSTFIHINITTSTSTFTDMNFLVDTSSTNGAIFIDPNVKVPTYENSDFSMTLYPNPYTENLNIEYTLNKGSRVSLEVYDIHGKVVAALVNDEQAEGGHKYTFSAAKLGFAEGAYFVKLQVNNNVFLKKVVELK
ncbi:MAG: T9SS type A sorting domain-containing protein [Bacteroidia bacterium]|nr:T9SS type A sorting domain-containing protein [Bacteroidia bacterium]